MDSSGGSVQRQTIWKPIFFHAAVADSFLFFLWGDDLESQHEENSGPVQRCIEFTENSQDFRGR